MKILIARCLSFVLAVMLTACGGGSRPSAEGDRRVQQSGVYENVIGPVEKSMLEAEAVSAADSVQTLPTSLLDGVAHGLVGDGLTDNTIVFQKLLSGTNRQIVVAPGDYVTGKLVIQSNTLLELAPGVTLRDSGRLRENERLINISGRNVRIVGFGARVVASRESYATGEQRHGVYIFGAHRVLIEGLESSSHGGDGFYIGGPPGNPSTEIVIKGCRADSNRRQGLSITSARRVWIVDCEFMNTYGTDPQNGIDLEPNKPWDLLDRVHLIRPRTEANRGGGILIALHKLDNSSEPVVVAVVDHASRNESPILRMVEVERAPGSVLYDAE